MKIHFNYVIVNIIVLSCILRDIKADSYNHIYFRMIETQEGLRIAPLMFTGFLSTIK